MNDVRSFIVNYYINPVVKIANTDISSSINIDFKFIGISIKCTIFFNAILSQYLALRKIQALIELINLDNKIKTDFDKLPPVRLSIKLEKRDEGLFINYLVINFVTKTIKYDNNTITNQVYVIMLTWLKDVLNNILINNAEHLILFNNEDETKMLSVLKTANKVTVLQFNDNGQIIYPHLYQLWLK